MWYLIVSISDLCNLTYFAIILMGKIEMIALLSLSSMVSRDWCVALPRGAMSLPAVCDCGISLSYSFTISLDSLLSL